jgi:predicted Zn-dependent peptidase
MKNKIFLFILLLNILAMLLTSFVSAYDLEKRVHKFTLKNGLTVILLERHLSPTVSFYIRHRVGAVDEENGKTGVAHLLEHMMFKGTKTIGTINYRKEKKLLKHIANTGNALDLELMKGKASNNKRIIYLKRKLDELQKKQKKLIFSNKIDQIYKEIGAENLNASTGQDTTTYHVSLPSNKIELWAGIESDRFKNPVFREFYTEREVIMEERRQSIESDPEGKLFEQFFATAFTLHPYRRPVIGWSTDMQFLTMNDTSHFFKRNYTPNKTVIVLVGDIDINSTIKIIKKYFGAIPRNSVLFSPAVTEDPPQMGERRVEVVFDANPALLIGYHKPPLPDFDDYVFDIIDYFLSSGRTSKLYKLLVEDKGLLETIQTMNGIPGARYQNLFAVFAKPRYPHTTAEAEMEIYKEIEALKTQPVSQKELDKIKNQIKANFIRSLDSNEGLANMLSYFEILVGDYRYITNHIKTIDKITADDIMRVAKKYLTKENRTIATLVKESKITQP